MLMVTFIKANGLMMSSTVWAKCSIQMEIATMDSGSEEKEMVLEYTFSIMARSIKETFLMVKSMDSE